MLQFNAAFRSVDAFFNFSWLVRAVLSGADGAISSNLVYLFGIWVRFLKALLTCWLYFTISLSDAGGDYQVRPSASGVSGRDSVSPSTCGYYSDT